MPAAGASETALPLWQAVEQKLREGSCDPSAGLAVACGDARPGELVLDPSSLLQALSDPSKISRP